MDVTSGMTTQAALGLQPPLSMGQLNVSAGVHVPISPLSSPLDPSLKTYRLRLHFCLFLPHLPVPGLFVLDDVMCVCPSIAPFLKVLCRYSNYLPRLDAFSCTLNATLRSTLL